MGDNMIDAVVTWVDGHDPVHIRKRQKYLDSGVDYSYTDQAADDCRFSDTGELWFCIHLIRKNAPWIETIYLVTDDQRPHWLTETLQARLNVKLVDHREIFKQYSYCLPTFNSNTIENVLFNIPGVSDQVVYFNDDCFLLRRTFPEDFFCSGRPVIRARRDFKNLHVYKLANRIRFWERRAYTGRKGGLSRLASKFFFLNLAHAPHALDVTEMRRIVGSEDFLTQNLIYRFRAKRQIAPISYALNVMATRYRCRTINSDWAYMSPANCSPVQTAKAIKTLYASDEVKMLCVQSLNEFDRDSQAQIKKMLTVFLDGDRTQALA
jgi:hypothetical protein